MQGRTGFIVFVLALLSGGAVIGAEDLIAQRRLIMFKTYQTESVANNVILGKYFPDKAVKAKSCKRI